jgi:hypothetical protein
MKRLACIAALQPINDSIATNRNPGALALHSDVRTSLDYSPFLAVYSIAVI